jgi:hypothetical protein
MNVDLSITEILNGPLGEKILFFVGFLVLMAVVMMLCGFRFGYIKKGKWTWALTSSEQRLKYDNSKLVEIVKRIEKNAGAIDEIKLDVCRILFYLKEEGEETLNRKFVRMRAGIRYIKNGGNHETSMQVKDYITANPDVYSILIKDNEELRLV